MAGEKKEAEVKEPAIKKKFFLLAMHPELWRRVNEEAAREARSAGMHIQMLLLDRFDMDARQYRVSGTRERKKLTERPQKNGSKKKRA